MATFGSCIAVAWYDGFVRIYNLVTGAMNLSLGPVDPIEVVKGSPDGSILFCMHREGSITLWDIQTGGLIRRFVVEKAIDIAVSLKGHYLFCLFSNRAGEVWEVMKAVVGEVEVRDFSPVTLFCWLEPEEQLAVTRPGKPIQIWDVVAGTILRIINTGHDISSMVYSQKLNRLAVKPLNGGIITIVDPQTSGCSVLDGLPANIDHFAFSATTKELLCSTYDAGLKVFNLPTRCWRHIEYPHKPDFFLPALNGTVVVGIYRTIHVLSPDDRHTPFPPLASGSFVSTLDQGRIIVVTHGCEADLLETSTLAKLFTISVPEFNPAVRHAPVLSASLKNCMVVYCLSEGREALLQLCRFDDKLPKWTRRTDSTLSTIAISPSGNRLVTFHDIPFVPRICMWDAGNGQLQAELTVTAFDSLPSNITFDSETRFYSHHDDYRVPYDLDFPPRAPATTTKIIRHEWQPWTVELGEREYQVDRSREWVVRGSKRIFWIPLGYLWPSPDAYCWAGSNTLLMMGEDQALRMFTFRS